MKDWWQYTYNVIKNAKISIWLFREARNWRIDEPNWEDSREFEIDENDVKSYIGAEHYSRRAYPDGSRVIEYLQKRPHKCSKECERKVVNWFGKPFEIIDWMHPCPTNTLELVRQVDYRTTNTDLPDDLYNVELGFDHAENPHIDEKEPRRVVFDTWGSYRTINACFRDDAVKMNGKVYPLFRKGYIDILPPYQTRPEILERWEKIKDDPDSPVFQSETVDAHSLSEFLQKMSMDYKMTRKLMFGYQHSDGEWRHGMWILEKDEVAEMAYEYEKMLEELEKPDKLEEMRSFYYDVSNRLIENGSYNAPFVSVFGQLAYIERMAEQAVAEPEEPDPRDIDWLIEKGFGEKLIEVEYTEDDEPEYIYDDDYEYEDKTVSDDGFSAFALHYGEDAPDWDMILEIKTADIDKLKQIKKKFFGKTVNSYYGSYKTRAELWYLTPEQRSLLWWYIDQRENHIVRLIKSHMSKECREVMNYLSEIPAHHGKALISCFAHAGFFEGNDRDFDFTKKREQMPWHCYEVFALWHEWKRIGKERKK